MRTNARRHKTYHRRRKPMLIVLIVALIGGALFSQYAVLRWYGTAVAVPDIPRDTISIGTSGATLRYVVMGDSTSIGQGAPYAQGIAMQTAYYLSATNKVELTNIGISGATAKTALYEQSAKLAKLKPDLVLVSLGANDVTHLTKLSDMRTNLQGIIDVIVQANCNAKIVFTGSPDMGAVTRLPYPTRYAAGLRTSAVNELYRDVVASNNLTFAPVADRTGAAFRSDHSLFAEDHFHPNALGYATWIPVLDESLQAALDGQPNHCSE